MNHRIDLSEITLEDFEVVGGKAARLAALAQAGFPVPRGFCITTRAFESSGFITLAEDICAEDHNIENRATRIRQQFEQQDLPPALAREITEAYQSLGAPPVAVRSSAIAEDTREFSLAGQHESFLQVSGKDMLLQAVKRCWASWWSPRAVRYRLRLPARTAARPSMAVLVQAMARARVSGVLFTVNPVTSDPDEIVINASPGLGEAIVSGLVTPDTFVLEKQTLRQRSRRLGDKSEKMVAKAVGTRLVSVPACERRRYSLTRSECSTLGRWALRIEQHFGAAQDIEFVHDGLGFWIVQARPVTGLSSWPKPRKGKAWSRHSIVEFMPGPLSPLFETTFLPAIDVRLQRIAQDWGLVFAGRGPGVVTFNGYAFLCVDLRVSWKLPFKFVFEGLRFLSNLRGHRWRKTILSSYQETVSHWQNVEVGNAPWETLWKGVLEICQALAHYWPACIQNRVSGPIENMFCGFYRQFITRADRPPASVFLRGHESEPMRAEGELFRAIEAFRGDTEVGRIVATAPTDELLSRLAASERGKKLLSRLSAHLSRCGHQFFTLDFCEPTLAERPEPFLNTVKRSFNEPEGTRHRAENCRAEREQGEAQLRNTLGPIRRTLLRWMLGLLDFGLVLREDVLFFLGLGWPVARRFILELGKRLVCSGWIKHKEDIFFLTQAEVCEISGREPTIQQRADLCKTVIDRRERWKGQATLKPPSLIPSDFRFWGLRTSRWMPEVAQKRVGRHLYGVAVSPGEATGPVRVIRSPEAFKKMKAGCILVAPMTTPAWTPLFALAKAVVTDMGGLLSHTSIVAREYRIPAVIGTGMATRRLVDGQVVTVDGDRGQVVLRGGDTTSPDRTDQLLRFGQFSQASTEVGNPRKNQSQD
jgi:pyruvate,water dikinase